MAQFGTDKKKVLHVNKSNDVWCRPISVSPVQPVSALMYFSDLTLSAFVRPSIFTCDFRRKASVIFVTRNVCNDTSYRFVFLCYPGIGQAADWCWLHSTPHLPRATCCFLQTLKEIFSVMVSCFFLFLTAVSNWCLWNALVLFRVILLFYPRKRNKFFRALSSLWYIAIYLFIFLFSCCYWVFTFVVILYLLLTLNWSSLNKSCHTLWHGFTTMSLLFVLSISVF